MSSRATTSSTTTTTAGPKQQTQTAQATQHAQPQTGNTHGIHDKIAMRAYEKWCKKGCPHGTDKQDWLEAEKEVRMEMGGQSSSASARR